jgi:hypothetical protein
MRIKNIQDRTVIYLDGRLDMAFLRSGIEEKLSNTIAQKETKDVIINLKKVEYFAPIPHSNIKIDCLKEGLSMKYMIFLCSIDI